MSKYYKTIVTVEILSEEPLPGYVSLDRLHQQITIGDWSGRVEIGASEEIDAKTMTELLLEQGSDPSFFGIADDASD